MKKVLAVLLGAVVAYWLMTDSFDESKLYTEISYQLQAS